MQGPLHIALSRSPRRKARTAEEAEGSAGADHEQGATYETGDTPQSSRACQGQGGPQLEQHVPSRYAGSAALGAPTGAQEAPQGHVLPGAQLSAAHAMGPAVERLSPWYALDEHAAEGGEDRAEEEPRECPVPQGKVHVATSFRAAATAPGSVRRSVREGGGSGLNPEPPPAS